MVPFGPGSISGDVHVFKGALRLVPSTFKLPHLHGLCPGSLIYNKDQIKVQCRCCVTSYHISVKGLLEVTGTAFILVFIYGATLNYYWHVR